MTEPAPLDALVRALLWREAVASVELDRDQTFTLVEPDDTSPADD